MPKRPPKAPALLETPLDLAAAPLPSVALERPSGRLWLADCQEFLRGLPTQSTRLVVADPPYAISKESWDEFSSLDQYVEWCDAWLSEVHRVLSPDGTAYVCGFSEILADVKARVARHFAGGCRWLIWSYRNKANLGRDWGRSHESILHLRKGRSMVMNLDGVRVPYNDHTRRYPERVQAVSSQYGGGVRRDRWEPHPLGAKPRDVLEIATLCNGTAEKTEHPTQKPEELIRRLVVASSREGDLVVDPFAGSGTTLVVAQKLGRRWEGADNDPRYVGLARRRLLSVG
ncbi:MAG: site-specific DNA-methyltransferase [Deltaproteobacteria bacterium]|nr:site-specific DNA-methyltransferase [Deltaproteobacteria bacterium]